MKQPTIPKKIYWMIPVILALIFASMLTGYEIRDTNYDECIVALNDTVQRLNVCIVENMTNGLQMDFCEEFLTECDSCVKALTGENQTREVCRAALSGNETGDPCSATEKLDMQVACYKGCQFVTQPVFNISNSMEDTNATIAIDWYEECTAMCEDRYAVTGDA